MIDRREFIRTTAAAAGGVAAGCIDGVAESPARRRAAGSLPAIFRSVDSQLTALLEVAESDVALDGRAARLFAFNGIVPGPRFEARAGDQITIELRNALSEPTNLHFHGLHVPPTGAGDNIFLHIGGGESFTYRFTLPRDHPAGLFWVHPHVHGLVARQLSRGLAAPFVIRGHLDEIPEVAAADERILLLQDFEVAGDGSIVDPSMPELMNGREGSIVTLGGAVTPVLPVQEGGLLRLRLVNASPSRFYRLQLEEHPLHVIAVDGGALPSVRTEDEILMVPGERLDLLIEGSRSGGAYRLLDLPYDRGSMGMMGGMGMGRMGMAETGAVRVLASVEYRGRAERRWEVPRSLIGAIEPLPSPALERRTFALGMSMRMGRGMTFTIDGHEFDANRIDAAPRLGTVEEWEYVNETPMDHPMHLHTNPFQIVGPDGSPERAWKDIVLVKAGSRARVRVAFRDYTGKTVQHCHILDHEDQGMMATVEMRS